MPSRPQVHERILSFALSLPGAHEDHPWGETVVKVGKKVFVFLGQPETPGLSVKLNDSHAHAMSLPNATPTGYGLGKSGWVTIDLKGRALSLGILTDFVEESYRAVAPKKLIAELDAR